MRPPETPPAPELRTFQREALSLLRRPGPLHLLCVAPTGSGKSLIYERLACEARHRILLITPLVALARQQCARLASLGVPLGDRAGPPPESGCWILSPESLAHPSNIERLRRWKPDLLVVDECHCLWDWGDGFRPSFNRIPGLVRELGIARSLWLTATLPPAARTDLRERLTGPWVEVGSFDLPPSLRLSLIRSPAHERVEAVLRWISRREGAGIVFVPTRQKAERIADLLAASGASAAAYHAGLAAEERLAIESRLSNSSLHIVVATSAFGMGVHIPSLRWAAMWQAPASLLSLAQAIGRVGRDPLHPADAAVFWDDSDFRLTEWMISGSERRLLDAKATHELLHEVRCRRVALRAYFNAGSDPESPPCGHCDVCDLLNR